MGIVLFCDKTYLFLYQPSFWKSFSAALLLSLAVFGSGYYAYTQSHEQTLAHVENSDPIGGDYIFLSQASMEDFLNTLKEVRTRYDIDIAIQDSEQDEEGDFKMVRLNYFDPL